MFSSYSELVYLLSTIRQHLWNSLVITPTTNVGVHSLIVYAGVGDIYFALDSRQHLVPGYIILMQHVGPLIHVSLNSAF